MDNWNEVLSAIGLGIIAGILLPIFFSDELRAIKYKTKDKTKGKFFEILIKGFEINTINTLEDILNIYKGLNYFEIANEDHTYTLNNLLRQFLIKLQLKEFENVDDEKLKKWKEKVDHFIVENEKISPFADLPLTEKNTLDDIITFLKINDKEAVERKILELSKTIQIRQEQLENMEKQNKKSNIIGVIGLVLTIIFGVSSILPLIM